VEIRAEPGEEAAVPGAEEGEGGEEAGESPVDWGEPFRPPSGRAPRVPFVQQIDEMDCGAACMAMICRHFGRQVSQVKIRELLFTSTDGTSLRGLCRGAEGLGLAARSVKASVRNVDQMPLPAIIHWGGNHWVVLYHLDEREAYLADPASGLRRVTRKQLVEMTRAPISPATMARRLQIAMREDFASDCTRIKAPTLVLTGESGLDRVVPVESTREYLKLIPNAVGAELARTGHIGLITRPDEWADIVCGFVERVRAEQDAGRPAPSEKVLDETLEEEARHDEVVEQRKSDSAPSTGHPF
jgi:hypothetical protein